MAVKLMKPALKKPTNKKNPCPEEEVTLKTKNLRKST